MSSGTYVGRARPFLLQQGRNGWLDLGNGWLDLHSLTPGMSVASRPPGCRVCRKHVRSQQGPCLGRCCPSGVPQLQRTLGPAYSGESGVLQSSRQRLNFDRIFEGDRADLPDT